MNKQNERNEKRKDIKQYTIVNDASLLPYLMEVLHFSRNKAKSLLSHHQISINGKRTSQFDAPLRKGDTLSISAGSIEVDEGLSIDIIYEDDELIAINKPYGMLSIANDKEKEFTAYHLVSAHLKQKNKAAKIFVLHRIDKETSGVLVFCKNEAIRNLLQDSWNTIITERGYYALVEGTFEQKEGHIENYLKENREGVVYSVEPENKFGRKAITDYKVIKQNKDSALLDIHILTGRKNQIRVTMADLGHPVLGDRKYGEDRKSQKRLYLHAYCLEFENPATHRQYRFFAKMPKSFISR